MMLSVKEWWRKRMKKLDPANLIYDLLHLPPAVSELGIHVLSNAILYLLMGEFYPGGYSRSDLPAFYAKEDFDVRL
jgi:hypothetical protein